ncbi:ABC transporter ATP-binding protein [Bacillus solitudinis]|uniref:ABC transporter ATP-binding protein n=1 Tax=Bacillus solitudinis TaxID=2014074 RepID=UPI000C2360FD|nr:dipeptide/oligopeptide/nickel ABC transporter ATP-binding protein [Bacillus solitudinis]
MTVLELINVTKEYPVRRLKKPLFQARPTFRAIKKVNLTLKKGESVGLVGESGSGKSTLAKLVMKLESLTAGSIYVNGHHINDKNMNGRSLYKQLQIVLQDSSSSLHPKMCVRDILLEPIQNYFPNEQDVEQRCSILMNQVNLDSSFLRRYPHQLSGGQKQRVCIAKALAAQPTLIIFDESLVGLDQEAQLEMITMLKKIQEKQQISYVFITHDLHSTKLLCDRVAVMYKGEIVEIFSDWDVNQFQHPYSKLLFQTLMD